MQDMCVSCAQVVLSMLIKLGQVKVCTCKCYRSMRAREVLDCKANSSPPKTSDGVCLGERAWDALGAENLTPTSSFFYCYYRGGHAAGAAGWGPTVMWNRLVLHVSLCGGSKGHAVPLTNKGGRGFVLQKMK